jgi:tetratricopeptide (TPR) repeat protein
MPSKPPTLLQPISSGLIDAALADLDDVRRLAITEPDRYQRHVPLALYQFSLALAEAGQVSDALLAAQESVQLLRSIVAERPSSYDLSVLAAFLGLVREHLTRSDRREEALGVAIEIVSVRRSQETERPGSATTGLAVGLWSLSDILWDLGRKDESLVVGGQAAELLGELVAGDAEHRMAHLSFLHQHADRLAEVGRLPASVAAVEQAVASRRHLYLTEPARWAPALVGDLHRLGSLQLQAAAASPVADGPLGGAVMATIGQLSRLAATTAMEGSETCLIRIGGAFSDLGQDLYRLDRHEESAMALEQAVAVYRLLVEQLPKTHRADLAACLFALGSPLTHSGRHADSVTATEEAVAIRRQLFAEQPDTYAAQLARGLHILGVRLARCGSQEEALAATSEAVEMQRRLAAEQPAEHQPALAQSLNNLGCDLADLGYHDRALAAAHEALWLSVHGEGWEPADRRHDVESRLRRYFELCRANRTMPDDELVAAAQGLGELETRP